MTLITKPDFTYVWASGGAVVAPNDTKKQQGWVAEAPPFQYDNWLQNRQDQMLAHINQRGIPAWDGLTDYEASGLSYVQGSDGKVYKSVAASGPSSVVSNPTTDGTDTYWTIAFADVGAFLTQAAGDVRYTQRSNNLSDLTNVAAARTNLALGTAATAALTTSATDTTAGSVLKVGDFGVGTPILTTNLNTLTGTGLFSCGDVTGTPGTSYLGWWVYQMDAGTGAWKNQTAWQQGNTAAQYVRSSGDGTTWGAWIPVVFNNSPAFTGTPTAPTPSIGTRSTAIATMQNFADEFGSSLAANGYQKLPSGLIIQWGSFSSGVTSYSFPIAFPTAFRSISCMQAGTTSSSIARIALLNTPTTSGFTTASIASNMLPAYWTAIGH